MGSGDWFKNIISLKKVKDDKSKQLKGSSAPEKSNGFKWRNRSPKETTNFANGHSNGNPMIPRVLNMPVEDVAATRIQTAFRAYMARKALRRLKGIVQLQILTQGHSVRKQALTTLSYLHSWSRIQSQIRARRQSMVTEGQIRQKKLENQLKLEAKLHDLEVEWCGGSETMDEILSRIHQREEAAVKRERAMAYAFSHQWRANSNSNLGPCTPELGKANWGWSWMERWIAARPWESRVPVQLSPKKGQNRQASKAGKNMNSPSTKTAVSVKSISPKGKGTTKARKLSYAAAEKPAPQAKETNTKKEQVTS
uniref:Protein IQ-DOMAIN 1 n=1 Tax=Davidia involucrata TaxID=16924 RepID=A0A5B6Z1P0_DAVIN